MISPAVKDRLYRLPVHFLCAGSSALALVIAHAYPEYWLLVGIALVPFLWQLKRANAFGAIILGLMLATSYAFVAYPHELLISVSNFLYKYLYLSLVFVLLGLLINRLHKYIGFNAVFVAALWLPLEYVFTQYFGGETILSVAGTESAFVIRFASLFGFLMVTFAIVLINSFVLLLLEYIEEKLTTGEPYLSIRERIYAFIYRSINISSNSYQPKESRGPPLLPVRLL